MLSLQANTRISQVPAAITPEILSSGDLAYWFDMGDKLTYINASSDTTAGSVDSISNKGTGSSSEGAEIFLTASEANAFKFATDTRGTHFTFGGTNDFVGHSSTGSTVGSAGANIQVAANYTMFIVLDNEASSGVSGPTGGRNSDTPGSSNAYACRFNGNMLIFTQFVTGGNGTDTVSTSNEFGVLIVTINGLTGAVEARFNGVDSNSPGTLSGTPVTSFDLLIGKSNNSAQEFTGKVYEIGFFKRVLTDPEKQQLDNYVKTKYNVSF